MRKPLGPNTPFTEVVLRVSYRLVELDYRHHPKDYYPHPPSAVLELCQRLRGIFPELFPFLQYYARNMAYGYSLATLRDNPPEYTIRSIAKLKPRSSARKR